ncbi:MAG: ABC transporter substrate-binding protein [Patescibacteria group bacterium]|nr:ABC transporter substrate-binding protein [Patescibacteria group bacterium]
MRDKSKNDSSNVKKKLINADKKLVFSLSKSKIPNFSQLRYIGKFLSPKEKWLVWASLLVIAMSAVFIGGKFYTTHLQLVPITGGKYTEALIGSPKNINPLYSSINDVDHDISQLIYSSLFKRGKNGELIPDLVEAYEIDAENKIYTLTIKQNVAWHDSGQLTIDDVIFTFNAIKNSAYKSPLRASFSGVEIEQADDRSIKFILPNPYVAFLDLLTFGIMPAEIWYQIPPDSASLAGLNLKPIGSGQFKFDKFIKDEKTGNIKEYHLVKNEKYYSQIPFIDINFKFYASFEEALAELNSMNANGITYLPTELEENLLTPKKFNFYKLNLPQLTAVFFNQEKNKILSDKKIRQALAMAINRLAIVQEYLGGDAYVVDGPILPFNFAYNQNIKRNEYNEREAEQLLAEAGWELSGPENAQSANESTATSTGDQAENITASSSDTQKDEKKWRKKDDQFLIIKLTTVDRGENLQIVNAVKKYWEKIGIKTELEIIPGSKMQSEIIKPRNFEALFYGQVTGADPDPYAFWHSSQIGENGFNIPNFFNSKTDQLLEEARLISNEEERRNKYIEFQNIIAEEIPAIFMYSPIYTYLQENIINNFEVYNILYPSDRFANIHEWYIKTGKKLIW